MSQCLSVNYESASLIHGSYLVSCDVRQLFVHLFCAPQSPLALEFKIALCGKCRSHNTVEEKSILGAFFSIVQFLKIALKA